MYAVLVGFDKNGVKTPVCFSEPSAYCCVSYFPYESELSTGSPPHISSGACATQKNKLAINRDKPLVLVNCGHHSDNRCCGEQNKNHWRMQNWGHHLVNICGDKLKNIGDIPSYSKPSYASLSLYEP